MRVWIFNGTNDALGHLVPALLKASVNAGDDHVHLRQHLVIEIE
jgi:hypothetical protein